MPRLPGEATPEEWLEEAGEVLRLGLSRYATVKSLEWRLREAKIQGAIANDIALYYRCIMNREAKDSTELVAKLHERIRSLEQQLEDSGVTLGNQS